MDWINSVDQQWQELKAIKYDLDSLCANVLLHGVPLGFESYVGNVWTAAKTPTPQEVMESILRVDAGHQKREDDIDNIALLSRTSRLGLSHRSSHSKPSKQNPCTECGSWKHWRADCPDAEREPSDKNPTHSANTAVRFNSEDYDSDSSNSVHTLELV
jgi:hypothetical protein